MDIFVLLLFTKEITEASWVCLSKRHLTFALACNENASLQQSINTQLRILGYLETRSPYHSSDPDLSLSL